MMMWYVVLSSLIAVIVATRTIPQPRYTGLGLGYDIRRADPTLGYADPGLKLTRRILDFSPKTSTKSYSRGNVISFERLANCISKQQYKFITGSKSFQNIQQTHLVQDDEFTNASFTSSEEFESVSRQTLEYRNVLVTRLTECSKGEGRLRMTRRPGSPELVDPDFAGELCSVDFTNARAVSRFIRQWGTHVVTGLDVGDLAASRYSINRKTFLNFALEKASPIKICFKGDGLTLAIDDEPYRNSVLAREVFERIRAEKMSANYLEMHTSDISNQPIRWTLMPITDLVALTKGTRGSHCNDLKVENVTDTIRNIIHLSERSRYPIEDQVMEFKLKWPRGSYGLPKTKTGCPSGTWEHGSRYMQVSNRNKWDATIETHWQSDSINRNWIKQHFCMKSESRDSEQEKNTNVNWPVGRYCIFKNGEYCPSGFYSSWVRWTGHTHGKNDGTVPTGSFLTDKTTINFCCKKDGKYTDEIVLPTDKPFYLFQERFAYGCQLVYGMNVTHGSIAWGSKYGDRTTHCESGNGPKCYTNESNLQMRLHYCYYEKLPRDGCRTCSSCIFPRVV
ncbi:uncharacterized protein LOC141900487 [Tubulanus polymorphus]|uniref:uncharacterized protein LOC141900487 n=1 Tax=Tubulanus polymorphus TaxID=672921 RepID=UPI003DA23EEF